jgi:hypothetical protein
VLYCFEVWAFAPKVEVFCKKIGFDRKLYGVGYNQQLFINKIVFIAFFYLQEKTKWPSRSQ